MSATFQSRYFARLGLDPATLDDAPTYPKLAAITEAHLREIPFGNLGLHGALGGPPSLCPVTNAEKVLDRGREGFCLELNLLLADLLLELGYTVSRIKASVNMNGSFLPADTHVFLLVEASDSAKRWFVDVAFGEPAVHPLEYALGMEQKTVDGMQSRIVAAGEGLLALEWLVGGAWQARFRWEAALQPSSVADFEGPLQTVLDEGMIFAMKFVVCRVTKEEKVTLAGKVLKRTAPRFGEGAGVLERELESVQEVREVLRDEFGIALKETESLCWEKSIGAPPVIWSWM